VKDILTLNPQFTSNNSGMMPPYETCNVNDEKYEWVDHSNA